MAPTQLIDYFIFFSLVELLNEFLPRRFKLSTFFFLLSFCDDVKNELCMMMMMELDLPLRINVPLKNAYP